MRAEFGYDGGGLGKGATVQLYEEGAEVGSGRIDNTIPMIFSGDETLDLGADNASPVSEDYTTQTSRFTGDIDWVRIDIDEAAEDLGRLITFEDRMAVATARQQQHGAVSPTSSLRGVMRARGFAAR